MKASRKYITISIATVAALALGACDNKKKEIALWDCENIAGMTAEQQFPVFQGLGCPLFAQGASGGDSASGAAAATGETATTTTESAGSFEVTAPAEEIITSTEVEGDFEGITFQGVDTPLAGFVGSIPDGGSSSASDLGSALITEIGNMGEVDNVSVISNQTIPEVTDTVVYQLDLETLNDHTATELTNLLLGEIGTSVDPGNVSNLPDSRAGEGSGSDFRVILQITHGGGESLVGVGAALDSQYGPVEATLVGFLDGTNIGTSGSSIVASSTDFTGSGPASADFLWVVDNSGSMSQEQSSVIANAADFFDRMSTTGLDFTIGVITTDSATLRGTGFTSDKTEFETAVDAGTSGSGTEAGIYHAVAALKTGGSVANAGKATSDLTVIFLSDEGDHYACKTGGSKNNGNPACTGGTAFDQTDNIFLDLSVKAYSIIGLDAGTAQPGTCSTGSTSANAGNNADTSYFDLAANTGGSSASICNTDYSAILENIATQAAANASSYKLGETPISSSIQVLVDGTEVERSLVNGFFYNSATNSIIFAGSSIPAAGATVAVSYNRFQ